MEKQRQYLAIDLKSYYASVECIDRGLDPLTTNLVVADESRGDGTICLAVSPSLKARKISGRARLFEVKQRLQQIKNLTGEKVDFIIAVPRMKRYLDVSAEIYGIYLKYIAPEDCHVYSIDEIFMDVTNYLSLYQMTAHELAITIIRDILETVGVTATAGIGTNMYLAKIAMDIEAKHIHVTAIRLSKESDVPPQLGFFTDIRREKREKDLVLATLNLQNRFGKNAVFKAYDMMEGATTLERNLQIGGHRA